MYDNALSNVWKVFKEKTEKNETLTEYYDKLVKH